MPTVTETYSLGVPAEISRIDQELKNFFQGREETRTRFGSLEFGVGVTDRADPWTRMSYGGPNKPIAPISDPYQMYQKLYGQMKDKENLKSILSEVQNDLKKVRNLISANIQFAIADAVLTTHQGGCLRHARCRCLEKILQSQSRREFCFGSVEFH